MLWERYSNHWEQLLRTVAPKSEGRVSSSSSLDISLSSDFSQVILFISSFVWWTSAERVHIWFRVSDFFSWHIQSEFGFWFLFSNFLFRLGFSLIELF